jgi:hypothetical protein
MEDRFPSTLDPTLGVKAMKVAAAARVEQLT